MVKKPRKIEDYEEREKEAITAGKAALAKEEWLSDRKVGKKGFFVDLMENKEVYPNHYSVHCVDGAGTKLFLSPWSGNFSLAAIDAVAMNVNDMATIMNASPDSISFYFACQPKIETDHMGEIMGGSVTALGQIRTKQQLFNPNIGKIETASLEEMIGLGIPGMGYDLGVFMTGFIEKDKVPKLDPQPGNLIVGVSSTGMHSNGYTGARLALLAKNQDLESREEFRKNYRGCFDLDDMPAILEGKTILEAMQEPTALYFFEASMIGDHFRDDRNIFGVNITGNGLMNFNRAGENISFEIDNPLEPLPIHKLLVQNSGWSPKEAYLKQNMGMGFAYVVPSFYVAEKIVKFINERGKNKAQIIGEVKENKDGVVTRLHKPYEGPTLEFVGYAN